MTDAHLEETYGTAANPGAVGGQNKFVRGLKLAGHKVSKKNRLDFLYKTDAYTLSRGRRKRFPRSMVMTYGIDFLHQIDTADLVELAEKNAGVKHLLFDYDTFSKQLAIAPLLSKEGEEVREKLEILFKDKRVLFVQSDLGTELWNPPCNAFFEENSIIRYTTQNRDIKAQMVERSIRTVKKWLMTYCLLHKTHNYLPILPDLVRNFNSSYNRSIKMAPNQVTEDTSQQVFDTLYPALPPWPDKSKFIVGDVVKVATLPTVFEKSYLINWSVRNYKVTRVLWGHPIRYHIGTLEGKSVTGTFYDFELSKATETGIYRIDKILRRKKVKGKVMLLVRWQGYEDEKPTWIPKTYLVQ